MENEAFGLVKDKHNLVTRRKCIDCGCLYRHDEHYAGISRCPNCNLAYRRAMI